MDDCHLKQYHKIGGQKKPLLWTMSFFINQSSCKNNWGKFLPLGDRQKKRNANLSKDLFSENGPKSPHLKKK
jgi:hypothetical protein